MSLTPDPGPPRRAYRPGDWFGIVGERVVVLLPPTEKSRVAALWELIDGGAGFDVTLDALISGGLRQLSSFALASTSDDRTQLVLRGATSAELVVAGESVVVAGSAASTWVERSFDGVDEMVLRVTDDNAPDVTGSATYVIDGGLFRMSRFEESPAHQGAAESPAEPAYEREFPLAAGLPAVPPADVDTEPDDPPQAGPEPLELAETEPDLADQPVDPAPVGRSPEPPPWTPEPPAVPPVPVLAAPIPPAPPPVVAPVIDPVDHDGLTVTGSWQPPPVAAPGIAGQPPAPDVTRPVARLEVSGGDVIDVDRAIVFGRAPEPRRFSPTEQPRLVTVASPNLEVSSTHLEVRPGAGADHGSAVVTDLGSTNGTVLVQAGLPPQDLVAGTTVQLIPGAVLDLGDGVLIRVSQPS